MDQTTVTELIQMVTDNILKPILIAAGTTVPIVIATATKKITGIVQQKSDLDQMVKMNEMKAQLLKEIENSVESAVAGNMQISKDMKMSNVDHKLTDEQKAELNTTAKQLVMDSLPESLTKDGGSLNKVIGGTDRLNAIIDGLLEKHVYKCQISDSGAKSTNMASNNTGTTVTRSRFVQNR